MRQAKRFLDNPVFPATVAGNGSIVLTEIPADEFWEIMAATIIKASGNYDFNHLFFITQEMNAGLGDNIRLYTSSAANEVFLLPYYSTPLKSGSKLYTSISNFVAGGDIRLICTLFRTKFFTTY